MTWLYLSLFFSMSSDDFRTRDACFRALKDMPQARRSIAVWGGNPNLELSMRRRALEAHWQKNYIPHCQCCPAAWDTWQDSLDRGTMPEHPQIIFVDGVTDLRYKCLGVGQVPIYKKREP